MLRIVLTVLLLAGCASQPTPDQIAQMNAGSQPGVDFPDRIAAAVRVGLKDPDSLKDLEVSPPVKCNWPDTAFSGPQIGYCSTIAYNAKNSYGGYTGRRAYNILYRDGVILRQDPLDY